MAIETPARRRLQDVAFFLLVIALIIMGVMNPSTFYISLFFAFIGSAGYLKRRRSVR